MEEVRSSWVTAAFCWLWIPTPDNLWSYPACGWKSKRSAGIKPVTDENDPWGSSPEVHHETKFEVLTESEWHEYFKTVWGQNPFIYISDNLDQLLLKSRLPVVCWIDSGCNYSSLFHRASYKCSALLQDWFVSSFLKYPLQHLHFQVGKWTKHGVFLDAYINSDQRGPFSSILIERG